jgi:hypothetical protein
MRTISSLLGRDDVRLLVGTAIALLLLGLVGPEAGFAAG